MNESPRVEFKAPPGFQPPQQEDPSADWDMVCSFRTKPDGTLCMTKLGDTPMPGYDGKSEKVESKPDYSNVYKPLMQTQIAGPEAA